LIDGEAPALRVEKLKKTYSNGLRALDGVSLEIEAGRFFGLLGPNGAGKTTLINSVVSLARPDSGKVEVFGRNAFEEFREARRMIGVSPQEMNLDKFLTVEEVLLYHAGYYGVEKGKARERADELLERFGLVGKRRDRGVHPGAEPRGAHNPPDNALSGRGRGAVRGDRAYQRRQDRCPGHERGA
jgi:ABC-2 type transport system ATP-binding protein